MEEKRLINIVEEISNLNLEDIKDCYDPAKSGFDIKRYFTLSEKEREEIYWKQNDEFFNSEFNEGTVESFLEKLKYDPRFTEDSMLLLFTDGGFHSRFNDGITELFKEVPRKIQETQKLWFWHHLRGYGFEHYLEGISGFGGHYDTRIDLK